MLNCFIKGKRNDLSQLAFFKLQKRPFEDISIFVRKCSEQRATHRRQLVIAQFVSAERVQHVMRLLHSLTRRVRDQLLRLPIVCRVQVIGFVKENLRFI